MTDSLAIRLTEANAAFRVKLRQGCAKLALSDGQTAALEMLLDASSDAAIRAALVAGEYAATPTEAESMMDQAAHKFAVRFPRTWADLDSHRQQLLWCLRNRSGELPDPERVVIEPATDHTRASSAQLVSAKMLRSGVTEAVRCYARMERPSIERLAPVLVGA